MLKQLLQDVMYEIYSAINRNVGVIDDKNCVLAFSGKQNSGLVEKINFNMRDFCEAKSDSFSFENYLFKAFTVPQGSKHFLFIEGTDEQSKNYLKIVEILLLKLYNKMDDKYEKNLFIKRLILNHIYPKDIEIKAKIFDIKVDVERIIFLVKFLSLQKELTTKYIEQVLQSDEYEFVLQVDLNTVVIIKKIDSSTKNKHILDFANQIVTTMDSKFSLKVDVAISNISKNLIELGDSYIKARTCLAIKKIFKKMESVLSFRSIGIARLIYSLPKEVCEDFLSEINRNKTIKSLDKEIMITIDKFFENNLNISQTSKKLFIHRNTLVYRLEKIKSLIGLDLRNFEQATTFKLAIMVKQYLKYVTKNA